MQAITEGFLRQFENHYVCHRIAVFDYERSWDDEGRVASPSIRITNIVSQSDMIRWGQM